MTNPVTSLLVVSLSALAALTAFSAPDPRPACPPGAVARVETPSPDGQRVLVVETGYGTFKLEHSAAARRTSPTLARPVPYTPITKAVFVTDNLIEAEVPNVGGAVRLLYFELPYLPNQPPPTGRWIGAAEADLLKRAWGVTYRNERAPNGRRKVSVDSTGLIVVREEVASDVRYVRPYPRLPLATARWRGDTVIEAVVGVVPAEQFVVYYEGAPQRENPDGAAPLRRITRAEAERLAP